MVCVCIDMMYSGNKSIKNTFLIKRYFATYVVVFSSSIKIEIYIYIFKQRKQLIWNELTFSC